MENTAKVFYEQDCDLSLLYGKTIAVIGYGSQGHAHALNAKESLGDNARLPCLSPTPRACSNSCPLSR